MYIYIDVSALCPGVSWLPLSTIVTEQLATARVTRMLAATHFCIVLSCWCHSELREFLLPLLFVNGLLCTNDVVLLLYHVLRKCHSERVKQCTVRTHFFNLRSQERIRGVICAGAFNYVYIFQFGILNQTIWSLARCGIVKWFEKLIEFLLWGRVLWLLTLRLFALAYCVKKSVSRKWGPFGPTEHVVSLN